jgi:hypothetical protein
MPLLNSIARICKQEIDSGISPHVVPLLFVVVVVQLTRRRSSFTTLAHKLQLRGLSDCRVGLPMFRTGRGVPQINLRLPPYCPLVKAARPASARTSVQNFETTALLVALSPDERDHHR